ncbi:hypothetical protein H8B13_00305 [Hymenobacter sp. BT188]|uniref:DUF6370 family protein n=1 Tax=Hymenobacter sp. BT188 TaxID=2763504 RepID=UPI0016517BE1|nr:DUF6370 family protein [Hymenobacter sp. BT188]MBC6605250.1 hypothetical protein [Hymenobacter sp. BT188]
MKSLLMLIVFGFFAVCIANAQTTKAAGVAASPNKAKKVMIVDASCGQCKLGLQGKECDLAVKIDGKAYFVDGTNIDSHGDAHAKDGFCSAIRKAEVQGEVVNNRFVATYFKLLPEPVKAK